MLSVADAGDFFSDEIPPADLYILARIIHDWPEEKCVTLLKKIHDSCRPGELKCQLKRVLLAKLHVMGIMCIILLYMFFPK